VAFFGNPPSLDTTRAYQGLYSLKLQPQPLINQQSIVGRYYFNQGSRNGFEFNFALDGIAATPNFNIVINVLGPSSIDGKQNVGQIQLSVSGANNGNLYYFNSTSSPVLIKNINNYLDDFNHYWHYIKLVFDVKNNSYIRMYFDNQTIDMGGVAGMQVNSNAQFCANRIHLVTLGNYSPIMRIDNLISTTDEP